MARSIEETLLGVGWAVRQVEVQSTDDKGNPVFNGGEGGPKMEPQWILDLFEQSPFERRVLHVPFDKASKDKLVEALTGGIAIVPAGAIPPVI